MNDAGHNPYFPQLYHPVQPNGIPMAGQPAASMGAAPLAIAAPAPAVAHGEDPVAIGAVGVSAAALLVLGLYPANSWAPSQGAAIACSVLWVAVVSGVAWLVTRGRSLQRIAATLGVLLTLSVVLGAGAARTAQVRHTVHDQLPVVAMQKDAGTAMAKDGAPGAGTAMMHQDAMAKEQNVALASGSFTSLAHDTTGTAQIVRLSSGRTQLVLRDLRTAAGPDLQVYLVPGTPTSDSDVRGYVSLGALKGTSGDQVYTLPKGTDASRFGSVVIWCRLATVRFGQADLARG